MRKTPAVAVLAAMWLGVSPAVPAQSPPLSTAPARPAATVGDSFTPPPPAGASPFPTAGAGPAIDDPFLDPFYAPPGGSAPGQAVGSGVPAPPPEHPVAQNLPARSERIFTYADFYHAGGQGTLVPPLVTQSPPGTTAGLAGAFGTANTATLFGNRQMLKAFRPGFRAGGGFWLDREAGLGIEANVMALTDLTEDFLLTSAIGGPVVARPVVNGLTNTNIGVPVGTTMPATITSSVGTAYWGGDANIRIRVRKYEYAQFDFLAGYRYAQLNDAIDVTVSEISQLTPVLLGNTIGVQLGAGITQQDLIRTRNEFHGGQVGLAGTVRVFDGVTVTGRGSVALGATISDVSLGGTGSGGGTGLFVQPGNAGRFQNTSFAVMPELMGKLGYEASRRLRFSAGYTWTYWSKIYRAADQIDLTVLAPGRPRVKIAGTDYWIQGWTVGVEWRW